MVLLHISLRMLNITSKYLKSIYPNQLNENEKLLLLQSFCCKTFSFSILVAPYLTLFNIRRIIYFDFFFSFQKTSTMEQVEFRPYLDGVCVCSCACIHYIGKIPFFELTKNFSRMFFYHRNGIKFQGFLDSMQPM